MAQVRPTIFPIVLLLIGLAAGAAHATGKGKKASPSACPIDGCTDQICTPGTTKSCFMASGCNGLSTCNSTGDDWGACHLISTSKRSCSTCSGGTQVCNLDGVTYGPCTSQTSCGTNDCLGKKTCTDGAWTTCSTLAKVVTCTACGSTGSTTCDSNGNYGTCTRSQTCGVAGCGGNQLCSGSTWGACVANAGTVVSCSSCQGGQATCRADGTTGSCTATAACGGPASCSGQGSHSCTDGTWTACSGCSGTGTCPTCAASSNPGSGTGACDSTCHVPGTCTGAEVCNACDDNGNGVKDEGIYCAPCQL